MKAKWVAFAGVFFAAGIPYWLVPYNKELPAGVVAIGLAALVIAGAVVISAFVALTLSPPTLG